MWELVMSTAVPQRPVHADWKTLYQAAILEPDKSIVRQKIYEAEAAVLARGRELFYNGGTGEEKELLEDALYRYAWESAELTASDNAQTAAA